MSRLRDTIERTPEYVNFINVLKEFHATKGTTLQAEPVLGGRRLDLYKIFQVVIQSGGFEQVTKNRGWKQVGDIFRFPSTCTNSAYILKGVYIRNLLGYEEEKLWQKDWKPPQELLGPHAHKSSTLAGKTYRSSIKKSSSPRPATDDNAASVAAVAAAMFNPLATLQQLNTSLYNLTGLDINPPLVHPPPLVPEPTIQHPPFPLPLEQTILPPPQLIQPLPQDSRLNEKDNHDILYALDYGKNEEVEWALDQVDNMSFPEKSEPNSPFLLQLLVSLAQPGQDETSIDNMIKHDSNVAPIDFNLIDNVDPNSSLFPPSVCYLPTATDGLS